MKSIKEYPIRATKTGKKRGRPSKKEMILSAIMSYHYKTYRKEIQKCVEDALLYGKGELTLWREPRSVSVEEA